MDRILFGDNQFFGINHLSEEKARIQTLRFRDNGAVIKVLDYVYDLGINTFMCTTHDRISEICDHLRSNSERYKNFKIYPCMPYAHKYANSVTEIGAIGSLKRFIPGSMFSTLTKGGIATIKKDFIAIMEILIDAEMKMFFKLNTEVIFLQNVVTDLLLGLGMSEFFVAFAKHVKMNYGAEPGFITMNMIHLLNTLEECGFENPIICSSINKIGFRMSGGTEAYERTIKDRCFRPIAMQVLAAGAVPPDAAIEYVCKQKGIQSILFGASTKTHIEHTKKLIEEYSS